MNYAFLGSTGIYGSVCQETRPDGQAIVSMLIGAVANNTGYPKKFRATKCADFYGTLSLNGSDVARVYGGQCAPNYVSVS
jgi:hypothetical protein